MQSLENHRERLADEAREEAIRLGAWERVPVTAQATKKNHKPTDYGKKATAKGAPKTPSKGTFPVSRDVCAHPMAKVVPRGGHQFWWTCQACGMRWERFAPPTEPALVPGLVPDQGNIPTGHFNGVQRTLSDDDVNTL